MSTPPTSLADAVRRRLTTTAVDVMMRPGGTPQSDIKEILDTVHRELTPLLTAAEAMRDTGPTKADPSDCQAWRAWDAAVRGLTGAG